LKRSIISQVIAHVVAACVLLAATPGQAAAQDAPETPLASDDAGARPQAQFPAAVLARLRVGQHVRVATGDSKTVEGRLVAIRDGRLVLAGSPEDASLRTVRTVWVRGRATKKGTATGRIVGGILGAAFLGYFPYAMCEGSCEDTFGNAVVAAVIGAAVGAAGGSLTGRLIGSAVPRWDRVYSADSQRGNVPAVSFVPVGPTAPRYDRVGSASLHLGYSRAFDSLSPSGAMAWRLSLASEGGSVTPSLEVGRYALGTRDVTIRPGWNERLDESLFHIGPAVSVSPSHGAIRPYAIAGVGFYRWNAISNRVDDDSVCASGCQPSTFLGASLGGGVRASVADKLSVGLEGRWHTEPFGHGRESGQRFGLLSVQGGATLSW
jgi:hypothetical protein